MARLSVEGLRVQTGEFQLGPLDLDLADGETLVLLGPSGSGKTTLLEALAGFHTPRAGVIRLDNQVVTRLPPERRRLALVVQDYALFPHLTVGQNVAFGLRYRHLSAGRVPETLSALGIADLAGRRTQSLSGGERQRVALARALVSEPAAFLLDEPLAALDAATRREVRNELGRLLRALGATCLLVTHDQADAFALGQRVALLDAGQIQQIGKPAWVYRRPANAWAAHFLGMEFLRPERVEPDGRGSAYVVAGVRFRVAADAALTGTHLVFRPEDVVLRDADPEGGNALRGIVEDIRPEGPLMRVQLRLGTGAQISGLLSRREVERFRVRQGEAITCAIEPEDLWPVAGSA